MRTPTSFSALIRWRAQSRGVWELDTRHRGFPTPEAAAMAANGLGIDGFARLVLEDGKLFTVDVNGRRERVTGDTVLWQLDDSCPNLPENLRFERARDSVSDMSARGLDRVFKASTFRVLEDASDADVDVRLSVAQSQVVVLVRGVRRSPPEDREIPSA